MQLATWQTIEGADHILSKIGDDHARTRLAKKMKNTKNIRGKRHATVQQRTNTENRKENC